MWGTKGNYYEIYKNIYPMYEMGWFSRANAAEGVGVRKEGVVWTLNHKHTWGFLHSPHLDGVTVVSGRGENNDMIMTSWEAMLENKYYKTHPRRMKKSLLISSRRSEQDKRPRIQLTNTERNRQQWISIKKQAFTLLITLPLSSWAGAKVWMCQLMFCNF